MMIPVKFFMHSSINQVEEMVYSMDKAQTLMDLIIKYLKNRKLPIDKLDTKT